jgi:hypothetical protein
LILNGNHDTSVSPQDAIDFYQQTGAKDKSLRIYAGVNHFLMNDVKGHQIAGDVISWMEDRLPDFLKRKPQILEALRYGIEHFDMDKLTRIRNNKQTL